MGFIIPFYIIFGTNLLTESPVQIVVVFAYFSVSRKRNIKRSPNRMKPSGAIFLEQTQSRRLGVDVKKQPRQPRGRRARCRGRAYPPGRALHPRGAHVAPPTYFFLLYIPIYPENIQEHDEPLFPPPQPSVPVRSHLGAFSGVLPVGDSITEGFYINTISLPMKRE